MLAGAAATSVATGSTLATAGTSRRGIAFERVVDAVDDLGMDPTGSEPIDDALDGAIANDTLIEFPPGEYLFTGDRTYHDLRNFGIRGTGDTKEDVVIKPPRYEGYEFLRVEGGANILLENFTLDQHDTIPEWSSLIIDVTTGAELHDIEFAGFNPSDDPPEKPTTSTAQNLIRFHQQNSDGVSNISGIVKKGPSDMQPYPNGHSCLYIGTDVYGELNISDCYIANMSSHAMYASQSPGTIRVENCTFENNNGQQCRVSGDGAVVRNCKVVIDVDNAHPDNIYPDGSRKYNSLANGIWTVSQTDPPQNGGLVEDTEIICKSVPDFDGDRPFLIECDGAASHTEYRNVSVHCETDDHAIVRALDTTRISLPDGFPDDQSVVFDGLTITGSANGNDPALDIRGRDATVKNCCIDVDGTVDGVGIREGKFNSPTGTISDSNINVGGSATVIEDASVDTSNLTYGESCSLPSSLDGSSTDTTDSTDNTTDSTDNTTDSTDSTNGYDHGLRVMADDGADAFEYSITVSGAAELDTDGEYAATPEEDGVGEAVTTNDDGTRTITGIVAGGGGDSFHFDGEILAGDLGGPGTVYVDGSVFDLSSVPSTWDPNDGYDHDLRVMADAGADAFEYSITVSGAAELVTDGEYAATPEEDGVGEAVTANDDGTYTITGIVAGGGGDSFHFDGDILAADLGGPGTVYVDGSTFDLSSVPSTRDPNDGYDHDLRVMADAGVDAFEYSLRVTGDAELDTDGEYAATPEEDGVGEAVTANDDGTCTITGIVGGGGGDSFHFDGRLIDAAVPDTGGVYVDDALVDLSNVGLPNTLTIDGAGVDTADYEVAVDGDIAADLEADDFNGGDTIDGATATGSVGSGTDSYVFSGAITTFELSGTAGVYVNGTQVDDAVLGTSEDATLDHLLRIDGRTAESNYEFEVTGEVAVSPDVAAIEGDEEVTANSVTGSVDGDVDAFRFSGDIDRLLLDGTANVNFHDSDG
ncbi:hypothetical protein [Halorientalis marina]|uniref:hypothetical protein n=1 Tax=Halorientalis marina TaxID=2931976 RepID=UPI001FF515DA|nr:hypothetical protein [Halorientalis marina]